jgi:multicomponent Na+:H+ antiporter subunit B
MMQREVIPRVVVKLLLPFILLFGLYVQFHGELGPGGGFQAGVILAAAVSVGVAGLLAGGNFLDYFVLDPDKVHGQERGIFWVEIGVLITVSGTMTSIYYAFASRPE